jgi:hypothetical protein
MLLGMSDRFAPKAEVGNLERIECSAYEDFSKRK